MRCREGNKSPVIPSKLGSAGLRLAEKIANLQSFRPAAKPGKFAGDSARGDSCYPVTYTHVLNRGRLGGHSPLDRLRKPMGVETGGLRLTGRSDQIPQGGLPREWKSLLSKELWPALGPPWGFVLGCPGGFLRWSSET